MTLSMTSRSSDPHVKKEDENIWMDILTQVQESHSKSQLCRKQIILIGDKDSGKSSLINKVSGNSEKASGLEYRIIRVPFTDMEEDISRNIGAWLVDPDEEKLLKYAINLNTFADTTVILVASMSHPQMIISSLERSVHMLTEYLESTPMKEFSKVTNKNNVDFDTSEILNDFSRPPLSKFGCNMMVVITDSDCANSSGFFENDFEKQDLYLNYISTEIRKFCLEYGAALIYLSVKSELNIEIFLKYLFHLMFSHAFEEPPLVLEREKLFIPAGYDTLTKIEICTPNNVDNLEIEFFKGNIRKPLIHQKNDADFVSAEPDEEFLNRLLSMMNKEIPLGVGGGGRPGVNSQDTPLRNPAGVQKLSDRRVSGSPGGHAGMQPSHTPKKDGKPGTVVAGEGVLQSFFNSLLNRRTGSPIAPGPLAASVRNPSDKATIRHEVVSDLAEKKIRKDIHPQREGYPHTTHTESDEDK